MSKTFSKGGIHPQENKLSAGAQIAIAPLPKEVSIYLSQHIGAPAKPLVQVGERVQTGQLIAYAEGFISANVHSSVTGTVKKIDNLLDSSGYPKPVIVIETEEDDWTAGIDLSQEIKTNLPEATLIAEAVQKCGIVGLGGATFPTHVKLSVPDGKHADYLLINAVECEPYLTCDHRLMLEHPDEILIGIKLLQKMLNAQNVIIGIENNKADAIQLLSQKATDGIKVQPLKVKYPQGGEKQLIQAITKREIPSGKLPIDVGVVVVNVATAFAVYEAVQKNKPVIERILTITGKELAHSKNLKVRLGTPISFLLELIGGAPDTTGKLILGGPMMGRAIASEDVCTTKGASGILLLPKQESQRKPMRNCIRCAKCVDVCPMHLEPYLLMSLAQLEDYETSEKHHSADCIECGSCSFICPSNRPLLDYIRLGKSKVLASIRERAKVVNK